jgi:trans-aconitate methyltransferase
MAVDTDTLGAYERLSCAYATEWEGQPAPADMYALLDEFFGPGPAADIGCGSGRDTAWLAQHGFAPTGYDASDALLAQARTLHPALRFEHAELPDLAAIAGTTFTNVLCETVVMHLAAAQIAPAIARLLTLLEPRGTLYVSWRVTPDADLRDKQGRLYAAFDPALVRNAIANADILYDETVTSASSGRTVTRIVARTR